jgi:hypothetical protein
MTNKNQSLRKKKLVDREALEAECLRALRSLPDYKSLEIVEIRASPRSRQGANWKIARIYPDVVHIGRNRWAGYIETVSKLMEQFDLVEVQEP